MPKPRGTDNRNFDQTDLNEAHHGKFVHRDYAAHYFRWGFASRFIKSEHKVIEIGCGQDTPLAKALTHRKQTYPKRYIGVDLNPLPKVPNFAWSTFYGEFQSFPKNEPLY